MISFFTKEIAFALEHKAPIIAWLDHVAQRSGQKIEQLNYIFCNDAFLHSINLEHLGHDTYTDIITFDHTDKVNLLEGDLYISIETVKANAQDRELPFLHELYRVMVHGLLHLIGYPDKEQSEKVEMRAQEDKALKELAQTLPSFHL